MSKNPSKIVSLMKIPGKLCLLVCTYCFWFSNIPLLAVLCLCFVFCVCHLLPAVIGRGSVANVCEGEFGRSRQSSVEELHSAKRGQQEQEGGYRVDGRVRVGSLLEGQY